MQRGPGWLYVGALSSAERCHANAASFRLLALWNARARANIAAALAR